MAQNRTNQEWQRLTIAKVKIVFPVGSNRRPLLARRSFNAEESKAFEKCQQEQNANLNRRKWPPHPLPRTTEANCCFSGLNRMNAQIRHLQQNKHYFVTSGFKYCITLWFKLFLLRRLWKSLVVLRRSRNKNFIKTRKITKVLWKQQTEMCIIYSNVLRGLLIFTS